MPGRSLPRLFRPLAGLALAIAAVVPATPAFAVDPPIIARVGDCELFATGPVTTPLTARIRSPNGTVRATMTQMSDGSGRARFRCTTTVVRGGDTVVVTTAGGFKATLPIPAFRAALDRDTDKLVLHGPRSAVVTLEPLGCRPGRVNCGSFAELDRTFDSNGRIAIDFTSTLDLIGGDAVDLTRSTAKGIVEWRIPVPALDVAAGAAKVSGNGTVGDSVLLRLRTGGGALRGSATTSPTAPDGRFAAFIRKPGGAKVTPANGDRVSADLAADAKVTIVAIPLAIDATTFTFTCPPNAEWSHQILDGPFLHTSNGGVADGSGEVTQPYQPDFTHGMKLVVRCGTAAGDAIRASATFP